MDQHPNTALYRGGKRNVGFSLAELAEGVCVEQHTGLHWDGQEENVPQANGPSSTLPHLLPHVLPP